MVLTEYRRNLFDLHVDFILSDCRMRRQTTITYRSNGAITLITTRRFFQIVNVETIAIRDHDRIHLKTDITIGHVAHHPVGETAGQGWINSRVPSRILDATRECRAGTTGEKSSTRSSETSPTGRS
jgi:hypothetical protein